MIAGTYDDFFEDLRLRESGGDYTIVNQFGFLGAYQFGEAALVDLGIVTNDGSPFDNQFNGSFLGKYGIDSVEDFLNDATAQDSTAADWFDLLWRRIRSFDLEIYDGQVLNGTFLTASGMIAGAHLAGVGGVRDFIHSGGFSDPADAFGTSMVDYIDLFAAYEVPIEFVNNLGNDNEIWAGDGDDELYGFEGDDTLLGFDGDDLLVGGDGADLLIADGTVADALNTLALLDLPLG